MLRSILLLLDDTQGAVAACGVATSLARRCSAQLCGIYFAPTRGSVPLDAAYHAGGIGRRVEASP